jgi:hypothetical protein
MTMSNPNLKYRIKLSEEERKELIEISKNGTKAAKQVNHANVLLMADDNAVICTSIQWQGLERILD